MRWAIVVLAGCGRIGFGDVGASADGNGGVHDALDDGSIVPTGDGSTALGCISPGDGDPFNSSTPCGGWGTQIMTQSCALSESGGMLLVLPTPTVVNARGGCRRTGAALTAAGVFVEISRVLDQGNTEFVAAAGGASFAMSISSNTIAFTQNGDAMTRAYDPVAMRWLRMRPSGGKLVFETSRDAHTWTIQRTSTVAVPTMADVTIDAVTPAVVVMPGFAQFEGVDVCPP